MIAPTDSAWKTLESESLELRLDADKSGVIEAEELKNALRAVGQHPQLPGLMQ